MQSLGLEVLFKGKNFARLLGGLWTALQISLISIAISMVLGTLLGILVGRKNEIGRVLMRCYLEFIHIMPQMVLLFIVFFGTAKAFGWNLSGELSSAEAIWRRRSAAAWKPSGRFSTKARSASG